MEGEEKGMAEEGSDSVGVEGEREVGSVPTTGLEGGDSGVEGEGEDSSVPTTGLERGDNKRERVETSP